MTNQEVLYVDEIVEHRVYGWGVYTEEAQVLTEQISSPENVFVSFPSKTIPKEVSKTFLSREVC